MENEMGGCEDLEVCPADDCEYNIVQLKVSVSQAPGTVSRKLCNRTGAMVYWYWCLLILIRKIHARKSDFDCYIVPCKCYIDTM